MQQSKKKVRVAAYCRISTNLEIQQTSLDTQIESFQRIIAEHPGWELAGIYADKGLSATSVKKREQFLCMMDDARAGLIDYILVKSISRFARNTVDLLAYVRELKDLGISVLFEKERLDTGSIASEFLLSIFAAAAQEEIVSLSSNMKTGRRMRYSKGIAQWADIFGFRKGHDGNDWLICEDEAVIVRRIYNDYLNGLTLPEIASDLNAEGVSTSKGGLWTATTLSDILHNEKYKGDILLQKTYVADPIGHKQLENRDGRLKQYYVKNHHPAIIDEETWNRVQLISGMRDNHRGILQYPYYGLLKCPLCGANMIKFNLDHKQAQFAWTCGGEPSKKGNLRKDRSNCAPFFIVERYIHRAVNEALHNKLKPGKASFYIPTDKVPPHRLLFEQVEKISFPRWDTLKVWWKDGTTSDVHVEYTRVGDMPFPTIKREVSPEGKTTWMINGKPHTRGCPIMQIEGLKHSQEKVMALTILEPTMYDVPIPHVYDQLCKTPAKPMRANSRREEILV